MKLIKHHGVWQVTRPDFGVQEGDTIEVTTTYLPCKIKDQAYARLAHLKCTGCIPKGDFPKKTRPYLRDSMDPDAHICVRSGDSYWIKFNNRKKKRKNNKI